MSRVERILERLAANPVLPAFALLHELAHVQLRRLEGRKAFKNAQRAQRRPSVTGTILAAEAAGKTVTGATVTRDGIVLTFSDGTTATKPDASEWDGVLLR